MSQDYDNNNLESAAKMITTAFESSDTNEHPLGFVRSVEFRELITDLSQVLQSHKCSPREMLAAVTELLMRRTSYTLANPRTQVLAARAVPIIRQLLCEKKEAEEILVIVAAILTQLALHADNEKS